MEAFMRTSNLQSNTEEWRQAQPWDTANAFAARRALADLRLYPDRPLEDSLALAAAPQDFRARLHQMVDELPATEIWGLYGLARILFVTPRPDDIFAYRVQLAEADLARVLQNV
jgi:hypothetical protein